MICVGFDIGGTKMEGALVRFQKAKEAFSPTPSRFPFLDSQGSLFEGTILGRMRVPTERQLGYDQMVSKLVGLVNDLCTDQKVPLSDLFGMGFAIPGSVDPKNLRMINGNTLVLKGRDFAKDIASSLGLSRLKLAAENDANCFALAEALCGAGYEFSNKANLNPQSLSSIGIILGTGCGGGIVIEGRTLKGRRGGGGEVGHTVLVENGLACWCGQRGCAEQYLSGSGFEQQFNGRLYSQISGQKSAKEIFDLVAVQDPLALAVLKEYRRHLAQFLVGLVNTFDPDFVVLGGGMSLQSSIYEGLSQEIERTAFLPDTQIPILRNALGDSAGVVGASLLASFAV